MGHSVFIPVATFTSRYRLSTQDILICAILVFFVFFGTSQIESKRWVGNSMHQIRGRNLKLIRGPLFSINFSKHANFFFFLLFSATRMPHANEIINDSGSPPPIVSRGPLPSHLRKTLWNDGLARGIGRGAEGMRWHHYLGPFRWLFSL